MDKQICGYCYFWRVLAPQYVTERTYCDCSSDIAKKGMDGHRHTNFNFGCICWQQREPDLREQLAAYAHEAWSGWMEHMFSVSATQTTGGVKIFRNYTERWKRQSKTKYADLPEEEKQSDRFEADRIIAIFEKYQKGKGNE